MQPNAVTRSKQTPFTPAMRAALIGLLVLAMVALQTVAALAKPESLAPLAEKISPSVVNITTSTLVEGRTGPRGIVPEGSPFEDFFREFQDRNRDDEGTPAPRRSSALGSGFGPPVALGDPAVVRSGSSGRSRKSSLMEMCSAPGISVRLGLAPVARNNLQRCNHSQGRAFS